MWLERAGYVTAHVGKFLNGYGKERDPDKPNGWTEWFGLVDPFTYRMWGYEIFENGDRHTYGSVLRELPRYYQTDVLTSKATQFIRRRAGATRPFFLSVAYLAPHHESGRTQEPARESSSARRHAIAGAMRTGRSRSRRATTRTTSPTSHGGSCEPRHQRAARGGDRQADARALGIAPSRGPRSRGRSSTRSARPASSTTPT